MTIVFNRNVSQYTTGDFATFKDDDTNGIARANGYVSAGYAAVVVAQVTDSETEEDPWGEAKPLAKKAKKAAKPEPEPEPEPETQN